MFDKIWACYCDFQSVQCELKVHSRLNLFYIEPSFSRTELEGSIQDTVLCEKVQFLTLFGLIRGTVFLIRGTVSPCDLMWIYRAWCGCMLKQCRQLTSRPTQRNDSKKKLLLTKNMRRRDPTCGERSRVRHVQTSLNQYSQVVELTQRITST